MQESWQVFMKPGMSTPHVDTSFQAAATTSMAGRVMFPFSRWSDIGETDGGTHGKHAGSNLAPHTTANAVQNSAEGHGDCKVSSGLVDVTQESTKSAVQCSASGLVCATEAKKAGHTTATQHSFGAMAVATAGGGMKADHGHIASAFSSSASSLIGRMAQINHINDMNIKQMLNRDGMNEQEINKKINTQDNAKNDMQSNNKILQGDGGVSNSKCKQHPTVQTVPRCQIDGCKQDLSQAKKEYHRRHKVCEMHSKASSVLKCGLHQRFCQQCSRFHVVGDFDDAKRSCRRRLEGHNRRRRKSISQGYGNLVGMNSLMHRQLMAATAMMMPLQQRVLLNQGKSNEVANNIQEIKYDQKLDMPTSTLPNNFDERFLALLNYNTKGSSSSTSSSSSSSPSPIFNHGDTTCALSLLSCHASLDQPLHRNIEDNCLNPNLSNNQTINNYFTFPNSENFASITSLNANKSSVVEYPYSSKFIHPPTTTSNNIESISFVESTKDLPYPYSVANYLKNLGPVESLEQHYNANLIAELLRQHQAYSNPNPGI